MLCANGFLSAPPHHLQMRARPAAYAPHPHAHLCARYYTAIVAAADVVVRTGKAEKLVDCDASRTVGRWNFHLDSVLKMDNGLQVADKPTFLAVEMSVGKKSEQLENTCWVRTRRKCKFWV
jgi:hypothetical protein